MSRTQILLVFLIAFVMMALFLGCSNADRASFHSMSVNHKVSLYSGGHLVGQWTSRGQVTKELYSDGCYFMDNATGNEVEVAGTVVIEQVAP